MRVLVLGGTQFVGRAVAEGLIARGWDVSILTRGRLPVGYSGLTRHYRADRRDPASLRELADERFDAVVDVSAYTAADAAPVLDSLRLDGVRYVLVSSGAVYAPSDAARAEDPPTGENEVCLPAGRGQGRQVRPGEAERGARRGHAERLRMVLPRAPAARRSQDDACWGGAATRVRPRCANGVSAHVCETVRQSAANALWRAAFLVAGGGTLMPDRSS